MRGYADEADLAAMQDLLVTWPDPFEAYPGIADLKELVAPSASMPSPDIVLWEQETTGLVGFAIVSPTTTCISTSVLGL